MLNIRKYTTDDLSGVRRIFSSNVPKYFVESEMSGLVEFLGDYSEHYYVVEQDGETVGSGGIALNAGDEPTVSFCWGMIDARYHRRGLGRALTLHRLAQARSHFDHTPIVIRTSQLTSGFYERLGFELLRQEADHFAPGIDLCEMMLAAEAPCDGYDLERPGKP